MKIGLVQYNPEWESKETNKLKLLKLISALNEEVSLLIFPEMTLTGFTMQSSLFAEEYEGESFNFFKEIAKENNCDVIAGIIVKSEEKYFNSSVHIDNSGKTVIRYDKIHPFSPSGEDKHYSAGKQAVITEMNDVKTGLSVCYDLRFPELFRFYANEKVDLIVAIANWPVSRIEHWRTLLKARAIENQCYVAGVNRVGTDPSHQYNGYSSIYDPMGKNIAESFNEEKIITAYIDIKLVQETRTKLPFLNDIKLI
ncbi:MAG: carbon-nitrogen family hydrolase [Ignavibacteriales bacterium]|nr:MAG: carbon-nitrogen family hydrolase [Ignavibacteriales bacterium]